MTHRWFWVFLGFNVITPVVALAINNVPHNNTLWFVVFSLLFFGSSFGFTLIFWPHIQFRQLPRLGRLVQWAMPKASVAKEPVAAS